jgi:hypothetical protein
MKSSRRFIRLLQNSCQGCCNTRHDHVLDNYQTQSCIVINERLHIFYFDKIVKNFDTLISLFMHCLNHSKNYRIK